MGGPTGIATDKAAGSCGPQDRSRSHSLRPRTRISESLQCSGRAGVLEAWGALRAVGGALQSLGWRWGAQSPAQTDLGPVQLTSAPGGQGPCCAPLTAVLGIRGAQVPAEDPGREGRALAQVPLWGRATGRAGHVPAARSRGQQVAQSQPCTRGRGPGGPVTAPGDTTPRRQAEPHRPLTSTPDGASPRGVSNQAQNCPSLAPATLNPVPRLWPPGPRAALSLHPLTHCCQP